MSTATDAINKDPDLCGELIVESREHLSAIEAQLLGLEQDPENAEAINAIFRGFHTVKGLAGFLDFSAIQNLAHEAETLLELARNSKLAIDSSLIDILLQSADHMTHCLLSAETGREPASGAELLMTRLREITDGAGNAPADLVLLATAAAEPARSALSIREAVAGPRSVKVDTDKLDSLVKLVSELAIAQSLILHDSDMDALHGQRVSHNLGQIARITADVQRVVMTMRMNPIGELFRRMARLARDLARKSGKQVKLELTGEETELDRNMIEELADPLMHMIRNAVGHGAELPEERIACGKSPIARIELKAYHLGGYINIEISDDGRGLVREKILAKARQQGLISSGENLSDQTVFGFILEPGFSTARQVTGICGRGVGMDVVRTKILKLRGSIDISSRPGYGATFVLKLPALRRGSLSGPI